MSEKRQTKIISNYLQIADTSVHDREMDFIKTRLPPFICPFVNMQYLQFAKYFKFTILKHCR